MSLPNIIFIVLDTFRADKIVIDENKTTHTPFIKNLIKTSLYFKNCIAHSPWTLPSHVSMFTGLYPTQNNLFNDEFDHLNKKIPVLPEILKELGYHTLCFTENAFISKIYGFHRGFDKIFNVWDWNPWNKKNYKLSKSMSLINKIDKKICQNVQFNLIKNIWKHFKIRTEGTIKVLIQHFFLKDILFKLKNNTLEDLNNFKKFLKNEKQDKPLFLFFNFLTTHDPYVPLKEVCFKRKIKFKIFKVIKDILIFPLKSRLKVNIKSKHLNKKKVIAIQELYNHCVFSADIVIKILLSKLKELSLLNNSYIIITSDHGEHLGGELDHNFWEHNTYQSVYDALIRVPLIIKLPTFNSGMIIKSQVQLKDLFHTILHLTGIPFPKNKYLDVKRSIIYQLENNTFPKYIYGEYVNSRKDMTELINEHRRTIDKRLIPRIYNHLYFIRTNKYKYIEYDKIKIEEFYDLENDPHELKNLSNTRNEKFLELKKILKIKRKEINDFKLIKSIITLKEKESLKNIVKNIKIKRI
ncbi:MAG: sulfatase-like hydrolase/transferase [Candidatus Helarchaeota archaeon]